MQKYQDAVDADNIQYETDKKAYLATGASMTLPAGTTPVKKKENKPLETKEKRRPSEVPVHDKAKAAGKSAHISAPNRTAPIHESSSEDDDEELSSSEDEKVPTPPPPPKKSKKEKK